MRNILEVLFIIAVTWLVLDSFVYSPKAQIKKLWKEVFRYAEEEGKIRQIAERSSDPYIYEDLILLFKGKKDKVGKFINALLDYHFRDKDDEEGEYIVENKYEDN